MEFASARLRCCLASRALRKPHLIEGVESRSPRRRSWPTLRTRTPALRILTRPILRKSLQGDEVPADWSVRGGRSLTAAGVPGDLTTYYFGSTGGGVWKSTDGAMTWAPVFDKEGTSSIGSLAVANSNPNVVYVGTGEACIRRHFSRRRGLQNAGRGQDLEERGAAVRAIGTS